MFFSIFWQINMDEAAKGIMDKKQINISNKSKILSSLLHCAIKDKYKLFKFAVIILLFNLSIANITS